MAVALAASAALLLPRPIAAAPTGYVATPLPIGTEVSGSPRAVTATNQVFGTTMHEIPGAGYWWTTAIWTPDGAGGYAGPARLPMKPGTTYDTSSVSAISDTGNVAGAMWTGGQSDWHPVVWIPDATATAGYRIVDLDDAYSASVFAMSRQGTVVGMVVIPAGGTRAAAWVPDGAGGYRPTQLLDQGTWGESRVVDVNSKGVAAGWVASTDPTTHAMTYAATVWSPGPAAVYGSLQQLGLPSTLARPGTKAIGDNGTVIGSAMEVGGPYLVEHGVIWPATKGGYRSAIDLGVNVIPRLINRNGIIAGTTPTGPFVMYPDRNGNYGSPIALPAAHEGAIYAVNGITDAGLLVGSWTPTFGSSIFYAVAWRPSNAGYVEVALPGLGADQTGQAMVANTAGTIAGVSRRADGWSQPTVWKLP
jgi:hypothetical protein